MHLIETSRESVPCGECYIHRHLERTPRFWRGFQWLHKLRWINRHWPPRDTVIRQDVEIHITKTPPLFGGVS